MKRNPGSRRPTGGNPLQINGIADHVHVLAALRPVTVSPSQVDSVRCHIANQEAHHRKVTFEEEYVALLRAHGVAFDERYIWD